MKHIKLFEDDPKKGLIKGGKPMANRIKKINLEVIVGQIWSDFNVLQLLFDKGYLNTDGKLEDDVDFNDINSFLEDEGQDGTVFNSNQEVDEWVIDTIKDAKESLSKIKI